MPDQFLTPPIKTYFDNMQTGDVIEVWKAKRPALLIWAAKEYIGQTGALEPSEDYTTIKKLNTFE